MVQNAVTYSESYANRKKSEFRRSFLNVFTCVGCGSKLVGRMRDCLKSHPSHFHNHKWRCVTALGDSKRKQCSAPKFLELAIEDAFMAKMLEMKHDQAELIRTVNQAIECTKLTESERERLSMLEAQMEQTYLKLKHPDAYVSKLIEELETIKQELDAYQRRQDLAEEYAAELKWFLATLADFPEYDPNTTRILFREDIFTRLVKSTVAKDAGVIEYHLSIGISCMTAGNDLGSWKLKRKTFEPGIAH